MPLLNDNKLTKEIVTKTIWLLLAIALNALELFIPRLPFLPWLKPGIANTITILWVVRYGLNDALAYTVLRIWISGFYFGFSFLTMSLALSGGILSTLVMGLIWKSLGKKGHIGLIGVGIIGALFHNIGQLIVVYLMMSQNVKLFYQLPFMFAASIVFGGIVGASSVPIGRFLDKVESEIQNPEIQKPGSPDSPSRIKLAGSLTIILLSFALLITNNILVLSSAAIVAMILAQWALKGSWKPIEQPFRFWPLFFFVGFMNLFFSYGTHYEAIPFITKEGLFDTITQWLRLWAWLQTVFILQRLQFQNLFFKVLKKLFPNQKETLLAGIMALEYFPEIAHISRLKTISFLNIICHPRTTVRSYIKSSYERIVTVITNGK